MKAKVDVAPFPETQDGKANLVTSGILSRFEHEVNLEDVAICGFPSEHRENFVFL